MYSKIEFLTKDLNYINEVNQFIKDWFSDKDYIISKSRFCSSNSRFIKCFSVCIILWFIENEKIKMYVIY